MGTFLRFGSACLTLGTCAVCAADIFVAPNGDDSRNGTQEQPLATIEAARDAARKAGPGPHTITVIPGDYFMAKPLALDAQDNGLTIEAASTNGAVTLYGGKRIGDWKRDGETCWSADLPGVKEGVWDFRALVVNGRLAERAVYPSTNMFNNLGDWNQPLLPCVAGFWERKPTHAELTTMPYKPEDIPATLDERNAEVRVYHMWDESLVGVASNDLQRHALILASEPSWPPGACNCRKYVIYNTREGMTRPGQWYLDRTAGKLVYWPLSGEDMAKSKIIAPTAERIIAILGKSTKPVERITLRNLSFQATTAPLTSASFGASAFDGAVHMIFANACVLEKLDICNVGGVGLSAERLNGCRITDCCIHQIGACGAKINGNESLVARNHIHHLGVYYPSAAASMLGGNKMHIYRNEIHDVPYCGIIISGGGHLIEENLIYRVMRELQDGGAIYGGVKKCILRGNMVRDVVKMGEGYGVSSYYLDEGSQDCVVERNVSIGVERPIHNHISSDLIIRDNVFVAETNMSLSFPRSRCCAFTGNRLFALGKITVSPPTVSAKPLILQPSRTVRPRATGRAAGVASGRSHSRRWASSQ